MHYNLIQESHNIEITDMSLRELIYEATNFTDKELRAIAALQPNNSVTFENGCRVECFDEN